MYVLNFTFQQSLLLQLSGTFIIISLIFQFIKKHYLSVIFLLLASLCIFIFAALLDPFLNLWDERFHALVSKNLIKHPLMPTLYDEPIVDIAYDRWDRYHIWLHKQPLFLWQIALSFKLFGISEFTLRLPSIVLVTIFSFITYRCGYLLINQRVGYIAVIIIISNLYLIELISGRQELEHNDIAFLTYISLSIWSLIEYQYSNKKVWIYLIGIFSGMAILCKWLVGLVVYAGWFILKLIKKESIFKFKNKDFIISLIITIIIAAPWQILTFMWYPTEIKEVYKINALHFILPIEGHSGDIWYHLNKFNLIYGSLAPFLIIPSFIIMQKQTNNKYLVWALLSMVLIVYIFFSIAKTKMPSFTIIISMIIFIAFASLIDYILNNIEKYTKSENLQKFIFIIFIIMFISLQYLKNIKLIQETHCLTTKNNQYSNMLMHNKEIFKSLRLPQNTILFNVKGRHYIEAMFYTNFPAYNFIPNIEQYKYLKNKNKQIAIFCNDTNLLPDYLSNDPNIIVIKKELQGYD